MQDILRSYSNDIKKAFSKSFSFRVLSIAIPIGLQSIMASSRTVTDIIMVSKLGEVEVASVGYGGRYIFILILAILGISNGGGVIISQYWGAKDKSSCKNAYASTVLIAFLLSCFLYFITLLTSHKLGFIASDNPQTQKMISLYILIATGMIIPFSISFSISVGLRSTNKAVIATYFTFFGFIVNIFLNYVFIFGKFGFSSYGVLGAAWSSFLSYLIEAIFLLLYLYIKRGFLALNFRDYIIAFHSSARKKILSVGIPITISSMFWAFGLFIFNILVAQSGTQNLTLLSLITPIESVIIAIYIGMSSSSNVIIAHSLGSGKFEESRRYARYLIIWSFGVALLTSMIIFISKYFVIYLFTELNKDTIVILQNSLMVLSVVIIFRALNVTTIVGILRAGGDTKYAIKMDLISQWFVAIPLVMISTLFFHAPFPIILLAINSEEIFKTILAARRYLTFIWCKNLISE